MANIVGVRFKPAGRVYYFDPSELELQVGEQVVVETGRGADMGKIVVAPKEVNPDEIAEPLKPVLRIATEEDSQKWYEFKEKELRALEKCQKISSRMGLPMKFITADYNLDGSRLTVFFSAEGRVDFRDLLKELTSSLKTRIELRQVGPRDEAKLIGGCGRCGKQLCCSTYLTEFSPVSIRMAKEQDLPLNPIKISGVCGRLLCCLSHESSQYHSMKEKLPPNGQQVTTPMGVATVVGSNPLKETVLVQLESDATVELPLEEIKRDSNKPRKKR